MLPLLISIHAYMRQSETAGQSHQGKDKQSKSGERGRGTGSTTSRMGRVIHRTHRVLGTVRQCNVNIGR